jgi:membrane-associated phospholipid phosphatase
MRRWLMMFAVCGAAVLVCMAYVDRPVADYVQTHLRQTALFAWTSRALGLLAIALILMLVVLFAAGLRLLGGRPIAGWAEMPLLMSWSGVWALSTAIVMKRIVGRSSPDPLYVERRVYEFHPWHGVPDFEAFPSATTAVTAALLAVVWIRMPRLRAACAGLLAVIAVALVMTNGHWLADVIGGIFLGASVGWMTVVLKGAER